ncbi:MAG TPA: hypothetical protein PKY87_07455, partial [Terricaulis sp.]|nr:hypothetical protein [Terricaulis sp.]
AGMGRRGRFSCRPEGDIALAAVSTLEFVMTWSFDPIRQAVTAGQSVGAIREQIAEMIASGIEKDLIFTSLTDLRAEFHAVGNEASEDLVLDVMDFLVGWCGPSAHL